VGYIKCKGEFFFGIVKLMCSLRCKGIACCGDFEEKKCDTCRFHIQLAATNEYGS